MGYTQSLLKLLKLQAVLMLNLSLLRLSRLVRVLRAARVFISVPEFYLLLTGLFSSIKAGLRVHGVNESMGWCLGKSLEVLFNQAG